MKKCPVCLNTFQQLEVHHIIPRYAGGSDNSNNLIEICSSCHTAIHSQVRNLLSKAKRKQYLEDQSLERARQLINQLLAAERYVKDTGKGIRKLPIVTVEPEMLVRIHQVKADLGFTNLKDLIRYLLYREVAKL